MTVDASVTGIKGVGTEVAKKFTQLKIKTVKDLIMNFPRRYDDYSVVQKINQIRPGQVSIKATIKTTSGRYARRGLHITEAIASDETGSVRLVWFNQPYRATALKSNQTYYISGVFGLNYQRLSIQKP